MFNPALIKPAIGLVAGFCTSRLVGQVVRANVTPATNFQRVQMAVGTYAIGSLVGDAASKAVLNDIESAQEIVKGFKEANKDQAS